MKVVVIGGTGLIGSKTVAILRQGGHEVVAASPQNGINTITGEGLKEAMAGAQVVMMSKSLSDIPGKELLIITVEYPPGSSDPVHRHNAQALVYVLEGSIVMGVNGEKPVTLTAGQTFYEGPNDIHTVGRNASKTMPAEFLVVLLKNKDAPVLIPVK
jgi:quercetin dioxygenase-like cupin family protein